MAEDFVTNVIKVEEEEEKNHMERKAEMKHMKKKMKLKESEGDYETAKLVCNFACYQEIASFRKGLASGNKWGVGASSRVCVKVRISVT